MKRILFLCVANSARSQMAEGFARKMLGNSVDVISAGSESTRLSPVAVKVMNEVGIDISNQFSKSVKSIKNPDTIDIVVTLCAEEVCPVFLGKAKRLHWPFRDPAADLEDVENTFRVVRDEIQEKIKDLKDVLAEVLDVRGL